ncbi:MAG: hypothetical protein KAS32_30205 [Candidatus Peribacteraceae bacterium]|nr:hypothetical protein [Candidatus Peribacteraceae bacterium]
MKYLLVLFLLLMPVTVQANNMFEISCGTESVVVDVSKVMYIHLNTQTNIKNTGQLVVQVLGTGSVNILCEPIALREEYKLLRNILLKGSGE